MIAFHSVVESIKRSDPLYPTRVNQIPGFPYGGFLHFQHGLLNGEAAIRRFAFVREHELLELLSFEKESKWHAFWTYACFVVPLFSIVLAVTLSWWFLFGVLYFIFGLGIPKGIYDKAILTAAASSEEEFCFLFYCSQICIYKNGQEFEWRKMTGG